ncbi:Dynein regulatory complex [Spironucleus salmonicida]|uniref:Dynein regulatory complex n=1 Tax=Spironucleus salmonicida TaxID=348837 RepID=V6LH46_9EUKA|nr:Dynein regulatory complex [Spironucleus salmonicida]|eukprot:EST43036.1 Dynein regulatory complex [Spironucleus salmonicida]
MPPKSAKGKKGKKAKVPEGTIDYTAQIEQLNTQLSQTKLDLRREQEERNFFQLERDKIASLYEVQSQTSSNLKNTASALQRELEEATSSHAVAVRVYQQKIKDVLYQNQNTTSSLKNSAEQSLRAEEDFYRTRENELLREIDALKLTLKEQNLSSQDTLRAQKDRSARSLSLSREEYEQKLWSSLKEFEFKLQFSLQESEIRRKAEISEIENAKNNQIDQLIKQHEKNFAKMKEYYQQITGSNLELIKNLKDEVEEMKKRQVANEQLMFEIAQENRRLTQPLQNALAEVEQLRKELDEKKKLNEELAKDSSKAQKMEFLNSQMQWENDQLKIALRDTARERDELRARFEAAVSDVAQRSAFRQNVLERRIVGLQQELENKAATLGEVMAAANLDGAVAQSVSNQLDNVLEGKNRNIRELSFELARVMRLYNEALRVFRSKMTAAGVDCGDMDGFRPFEVRDDL